MAGGHGGYRPGSGRKPGSVTRKTREIADGAAARGVTPLAYLISVMSDPQVDAHRRDQAAIAALPYVHPRLSHIGSHTDLSSRGDIDVVQINIVAVPSGHDCNGEKFDFNRPRLVSPVRESAVVIEEIVDESEPASPEPSDAA
jgi:hypothetical protein